MVKDNTEYNKIEVKGIKVSNGKESDDTERNKKDAIVSAPVKKQKKGLVERLVVGILGPDGLPAIGDYLGKEIVLPAVKNIIVDSITSGINMAMFGDGRGSNAHIRGHGPRPSGMAGAPRTNYTNRYMPSQPPTQSTQAVPVRDRLSRVVDYIIPDRNECLQVLDNLMEQADAYDTVSIADYYDLIGVETQYTDNTYGWTVDEIHKAQMLPTRGGFIIKLPAARVI